MLGVVGVIMGLLPRIRAVEPAPQHEAALARLPGSVSTYRVVHECHLAVGKPAKDHHRTASCCLMQWLQSLKYVLTIRHTC